MDATIKSAHDFVWLLTTSNSRKSNVKAVDLKVSVLFSRFSKFLSENRHQLTEDQHQHAYSVITQLSSELRKKGLVIPAKKIEGVIELLKNTGIGRWNAVANAHRMEELVQSSTTRRRKPEELKLPLDFNFVCDAPTFQANIPFLQGQISNLKDFDVPGFLMGRKGRDPLTTGAIDALLGQAVDDVRKKAVEISKSKEIPLEKAYKLLVGVVDRYDDISLQIYNSDKASPPPSTFALRSAILIASQQDGVNLDSWMVYTKSGKPDYTGIWTFLDNWKNWTPEAQGAMAKLGETMIVKATQLAEKHQGGKVILLKGGSGAGKTRLTGQLMGKHSGGVMAPDAGKKVVRRPIESASHAAAHVQGSQLAYRLFSDMIDSLKGTVVYDSTLGNPRDLANYLEKVKSYNAKKKADQPARKLVVYDVARNDTARALAVLKRSVEGEDPRIHPDFIIRAAIYDKLNRVKCMEVILNDTVEASEERAEYHFIGGDQQGWNTEEVMTLGSNREMRLTPLAKERLALEGIQLDEEHEQLSVFVDESFLKNHYQDQFNRPVKELLSELSAAERTSLIEVFAGRTLPLAASAGPITNASEFYDALPLNIRSVVSKTTVQDAFSALGDGQQAFFSTIEGRSSISYLDLPLRTALIIHHNLQKDPWK